MQFPSADFRRMAAEAIAALEHVPLPTALVDEGGIIRWQNKTSRALRGSRIGLVFFDFLTPEDRPQARAVFERILEEEGAAELAVRALNADGEYALLDGRWNVVRLRDGRKVVVVLSLGDAGDGEGISARGERSLLTPRQLDVLELLTAGKSTVEIATKLGLRPTTVRNHVANLLAVLGVHSRLQAVVAARKAGLVDPDSS
jgi:DNA-binding CsgD family transcriptional regulator